MSGVFANAMEVSSKSMSGKSICQFPDVCFTPPLTPATPPGVPIPYPNTGMAGDTTDGSTTVKIGGEQVMLKDRSSFKTSTGDEAGSAPKKGLINSKIKGKVYFIAWSMDVKVEGENVVRNLDMTTHNHACKPPNGAVPTVHVALVKPGFDATNCTDEIIAEQEACKDFEPYTKGKAVCTAAGMTKGVSKVSDKQHKANATAIQTAPAPADAKTPREKALGCLRARRCRLVPYNGAKKNNKAITGCCPSQTPDHVLPKSSFKNANGGKMTGWAKYKSGSAPCMCAEGPSNTGSGSHPIRHSRHKNFPPKGVSAGDPMPYDKAITHAAETSKKTFKRSGCSQKCIEGQLDAQHKAMAKDKQNPADVTYSPSGSTMPKKDVALKETAINTGGS